MIPLLTFICVLEGGNVLLAVVKNQKQKKRPTQHWMLHLPQNH